MNIDTDNLILEIHGAVKTLVQKVESHIENETIHTVPPCEFQKQISAKFWAICLAVIMGMAASLWNVIQK